jgi:alpha-ribazole phosphatase
MQLIMVRHSQTIENKKDIAQAQDGGTLSKKGKRQLKKLSNALKNEKIDVILSSDALRTKETANEINKFHNVKIIYDPLLREKHMGCFVGKPRDLFWVAREKSGLPKVKFRPDGGESYTDMWKRAKKFLTKLKKRKEKTIVIVTHGGFIKMFFSVIFGIPLEKAFDISIDNACINKITMSKNPKLLQLNYTKHLRGCK